MLVLKSKAVICSYLAGNGYDAFKTKCCTDVYEPGLPKSVLKAVEKYWGKFPGSDVLLFEKILERVQLPPAEWDDLVVCETSPP